MNKKKHIIISTLLVALLLTIGVVLFFVFDKEQIAKAENSYNPSYHSYCSYEHDAEMKIDGVLDESAWKDKKWFSNTFLNNTDGNLPSMKVTGFMTDYGIYLASTVIDDNIVNDGQRSPKLNSNWEFYLSANQAGEYNANDGLYRYQFNIDMRGDSYTRFSNFDRAIVVDGEINSGETKGATLEMFVPWQTIGIEPSKGLPSEFLLMPAYRTFFIGQSETSLLNPISWTINGVRDFFIFDKNGYTSMDREDAIVGDTKFGSTKTANWDISEEKDGIVQSSKGTEHHKIFFSEEYGSDFIVETTIIPVKSLENDFPKAGIYFHSTDGLYYSVLLDMNKDVLVDSVNGTKNFSKYQIVTINNNEGTWNQKSLTKFDSDNLNASKKEGVKLTVIKYGGKFWYFVDGKFVTAEEHPFMDIDVFPGFYSLGAHAIYKDYSCTTLKNEKALQEYLNERDLYLVNAKVKGGGGSVTASATTVRKGENYDITLISKSGYEVSSILVNGEERIKDARKNAVDGVYTITNAGGNQEVVVKFAKCNGAKFSGHVRDLEGAIAAKITLYGQSNKLLCYEIKAAAKKGFSAEIPSGVYKVLVAADNYKEYTGTITIDGDTEKDFTLEYSEFPDIVKVNGKEITSLKPRWDLTKQGQNIVSTSYDANGKMAPLYFNKTGKDFVMEATINYTTNFVSGKSYQPDLMGGFVFNDGTNIGWIMARGTGIVTTGWKFTNGMLDYDMLTYPTKKEVTFSIAKKGDEVYIYFNGELAGTKKWSEVAPAISVNSEMALGLYMVADKTADIEFSNYKVSTGTSAAASYINKHALKDTAVDGSSIFAKVVTVNGTPLKSMIKRWDLSNVAVNQVYGSYELGTKTAPLYLAKHGSTILVQTTIEYTTQFQAGIDYQKDLMGGFIFNDGKNSGWVMASQTGIVYTGWKFEHGLVEEPVLTYPEKRSVQMSLAIKDGYAYIFFDDTFIAKKKMSSLVPNAVAGTDYAVGLYMVTDKPADIKFSNTSISTDANIIANYISNNRYKDDSTGTGEASYNPIVHNFIKYARQLGQGHEIDGQGNLLNTISVTNNTTVFIGDSFFDRRYFWTDFYSDDMSGKDALLAGIGSTRTDHWSELADEIFALFGKKSPKNIVIHLGTNDIGSGSTTKMTTTSLQNLFKQLHKKYPNTNIYYFGITDRYDHTQLRKTIAETNSKISAWCADKDYITYIDTPSLITKDMLMSDNLHPKLETYSVFTDALKKAGCVITDK